MFLLSTSERRPSHHPDVSVVFAVHDPEYGGGLLARTQKHIDALIELANRYHLRAEIVIVEWNPRTDQAPFRESLRWPDDLGSVSLRFLEVPADIHWTLPNADRIPIFEYIAKNAGLRRARGRFLLATNPDLLYSPALVRWLARAAHSAGTFYRVDRCDLSEDIPDDLTLSGRLRFCREHVAQIHALFGSYPPRKTGWWARLRNPDHGRHLKEEYDGYLHETTCEKPPTHALAARLLLPADGLHRNAAGDFFMMERQCWSTLRGYPELYTHAHIDAILCWIASSAGLVQEVLPSHCRLYHQMHDRSSHGRFPQTDWRPWYDGYVEAIRTGAPMIVNRGDWGLANEMLCEWEASPRLVQVAWRPSPVGAV